MHSLIIYAGGDNAPVVEVDYATHVFHEGPMPIADLLEYRDILSAMALKNAGNLNFLTSPTVFRSEPHSEFFDRVVKYIFIVERIKRRHCTLILRNLNYPVFVALAQYATKSGIRTDVGRGALAWLFVKKYTRFSIKVIGMVVTDLFFFLYARRHLQPLRAKEYGHVILSFYDYRANDNGKYRDPYFNAAHRRLLDKGESTVVFVAPLYRISPLNLVPFLKYVRGFFAELAGFEADCEIRMWFQLVSLTDILLGYLRGLGCRVVIKEPLYYKGEDITHLFNYALREEYFRCGWKYPYGQRRFFKRLFSRYKIKHILYPFENLAWERVMILERNRLSPGTRLTGFQASSVSLQFLNYIPGKYELALGLIPDRILTVGEVMKDFLYEYGGGYPSGLIQTGAALRAGYLFEPVNLEPKTDFSRKIAVSFSGDIRRYPGIIRVLNEVFQGTDFTIFLKCHPIIDEKIIENLNPIKNLQLVKHKPWNEIYNEIDILLYDDNTTGAEAVRYNIAVGCLMVSGQLYNTDRLYGYSGNQGIINSSADLRRFLDDYYRNDPSQLWKASLPTNEDYWKRYFSPITAHNIEKYF